MPSALRPLPRRTFGLAALATAVALSASACGPETSGSSSVGAAPAASAPLATSVPKGTVLRIADQNRLLESILHAAGQDQDFPYEVEYEAFQGGPAVLEAFRAGEADAGFVSDAPVVFAQAHDQDVKITGVVQNSPDATHLWTAPESDVRELAGLKGKKIAYTEGTTFQAAVLNALGKAGLSADDVTLVKLSDPSQIPAALASGQVDAGTLTEPLVTKYATVYEKKGAHEVAGDTGLTSGLQFVIAPGDALADRATSAALADLSTRFTKAELWLAAHKEAWVEEYYVKVQKVDRATGQAVVANNGTPSIPTYAKAAAALQDVADVLAAGGAIDKLDVSKSFDNRFDAVQQGAAK
ncbi:ABC transporter substrate-binding protein [Streptomyces sp. NPDC060198]|uniref:ABC transporter substrate-binding protein n=1 Tax=Streptomyces sp. NPDC060198 TaxID=3347070 RepID=UPI003651A25F